MAEGKLESLVRDGLPVDEELREVHKQYLISRTKERWQG
jgi:hypothetical protein